MKKITTLLVVTFILIIGIMSVPNAYENSLSKAEISVISNIVYTEHINLTGEVAERDRKEIKTEAPIIIKDVLVDEGDEIKNGQVVATVDKEKTALKLIEINNQARINNSSEYSQNAYIPDNVSTDFTGKVKSVDIKDGDFIESGAVVCTISNSQQFVINTLVTENNISELKVGQKTMITGKAFQGEYSGTIESISDDARKEFINGVEDIVLDVVIAVDNPDKELKSGYSTDIEVHTSGEKKANTIPYEALMQNKDGTEYVYIFSDGKAIKRSIKTGAELREGVTVLSGLSKNDKVLVTTDENIQNGQYVKVVE